MPLTSPYNGELFIKPLLEDDSLTFFFFVVGVLVEPSAGNGDKDTEDCTDLEETCGDILELAFGTQRTFWGSWKFCTSVFTVKETFCLSGGTGGGGKDGSEWLSIMLSTDAKLVSLKFCGYCQYQNWQQLCLDKIE